MNVQVIGLDVGFGFTKATDGRRLMLFKTVTGVAPERLPPFSGPPPGSADAAQDVYLDGQRILLGEAAETYTRNTFATLAQDELLERVLRPCSLAVLARMAGRRGRLRVVTGLPVDYFEAYHEALANALLGRHQVGMADETGRLREHDLHVDRVRVIPQPFGSVFEILLNDLGKVVKPELARMQLGVIDVGFRTVDFCIADHGRLIKQGSGSSDEGMSNAYARIAQALEDASGRRVPLHRLHEAIAQGAITVDGRAFDLQGICAREFARLAAVIGARTRQLWGEGGDADAVVLTGGGGAALAPYLRRVLKGRVISMKKSADARLGNVRGYWRYGIRSWQD